jgi:hypothetical protein
LVLPYDWQVNILLNYEAGYPTAAAGANFTGKTSTVFPIAALWTLYNFPRARVMYISATGAQVSNQFFASLDRFRSRPAFNGWSWLETEVRNPAGGFCSEERPTPVDTSKEFITKLICQPLSWSMNVRQSVTTFSMLSNAATFLTGCI